MTTLTYTGNLGGPGGANAKCQIDYPGSHMCAHDELVKTGTTSITSGWVHPATGNLVLVSGMFYYYTYLGIYASPSTLAPIDCSGWTSAASTAGGIVPATDLSTAGDTCDQTHKIGCCE